MVTPPSDISKIPTAPGVPNLPPSQAADADNPQSAKAQVQAALTVDLADIRPLELADALRILIAEIRTAFDLPLLNAAPTEASIPDLQLRTAREIVEALLQSLPRSDQDAAAWGVAVPRAEQSLAQGLERAISVISTWRDVPTVVVRDVQDSSRLALAVLSDEPLNPLWLRPEWLGLAPQLRRYVKLRRALRRRATDPDYWPGVFEDDHEHRQ
jgi:hypothetical protein